MNRITTRIASLALALTTSVALASLASAALAGQPGDLPSRTVYYGDLNLNTSAGAKALYRRIHNAAEEVCQEQVGNFVDFPQRRNWVHCINTAVASAVAKVNNAQLTALYIQGSSKKVG